MKTQLNKIILDWIGEDNHTTTKDGIDINILLLGYNNAIQDLRNKSPELVEKIIDEIAKQIDNHGVFVDTKSELFDEIERLNTKNY